MISKATARLMTIGIPDDITLIHWLIHHISLSPFLYLAGIKEVLNVLAAFGAAGSSHFSVLSAAISSTSTIELTSKRFLAVSLCVCVCAFVIVCVCIWICLLCVNVCCVCSCVREWVHTHIHIYQCVNVSLSLCPSACVCVSAFVHDSYFVNCITIYRLLTSHRTYTYSTWSTW